MEIWPDREGLLQQKGCSKTRASYQTITTKERKESKVMDIVKDIVDKYTTEQIIDHLSSVMGGVLMNYRTSLKQNQPQAVWGSLGDIAQVRAILHEMDKRNKAREALKEK